MFRWLLIVLFLALGVLNIFLFKDWFNWGVENGLSWLTSALLGWMIAILSAVVLSFLILKSNIQKKSIKIILAILIFIGIGVGTFAVNPIYAADYAKESIPLQFDEHVIAKQLNSDSNKEFNGLVLIARSGCPFCHQAIQDFLVPLRKRNPELDLAVYLADGNEAGIKSYQADNTGAILFTSKSIPIPDNQTLTISGYPTFAYVKNGTLIHQWSNNDFGYRALDWIEDGME